MISLDDRIVELACPEAGFDHNSPEHAADPVASYRRLRNLGPVVLSMRHDGFWVFTDYESVFEAACDDQVFSSARCLYGGGGFATDIPKVRVNQHIPVELDPPEHRKYRKLINPLTAPAAVEGLRPTIEQYTTWFIDRVIEEDCCGFATIIGVPAVVTIDWLGLPSEDWVRYAHAHHVALSELPGTAEFAYAIDIEFPWMEKQLRSAVAQHRIEPRDDVPIHLVTSRVDGRPPTDDEVFAMAELLISGGVGTTASLVDRTLMYLDGDRVLLSWASANRDTTVFENPDTVDIERRPNRHTSFGMGVHRCAGLQ